MNGPGIARYPNIFSALKVGGAICRNRVKYAACSVSNFNTRDGSITDREYARMEVIARTGAGMITNQGAYPDSEGAGKAYYRQLSIADDQYIPGFRKIADMLHRGGAIAIQQILHAGRYGGIDLDHCVQPSEVPQTLRHFRPPRQMSRDDIRRCVQDHCQASRRAMEAGFDGVEITAFMGYLLANFLSPFTNRRTDEYGGSLENRGRFMVELLDAIREAIGKDRLLIIRLNGEELMDERGGNSPPECIEFMKMAEQAGADCISIVVGWHESTRGALGRDVHDDQWLPLAENASRAVKIPVAFGPRFCDPVKAEQALARGAFGLWEVCRPFLADPELLHKVARDRLEEIRPCVGGLLCLSRMFRNLPYICAVNPRLGHEVEPEYELRPARMRKKVLVIGGGPGGLECAFIAAQRGHSVVLCEKSERLGGQLLPASREIGGGRIFVDLARYYETMLKKFNVEVRLGTEVTPQLCAQIAPDVSVVATGSEIEHFPIPGIHRNHVVIAHDILEEGAPCGDRVVVLGGERIGLVAAEYLASRGKQVTLIELGKRLGEDVIATFKWRHTAWVRELQIQALLNTRAKEVTEEGVVVEEEAGSERLVPADTVILAIPRKARQQLLTDLEFVCDELYAIGDAVKPRSMHNAIREGYLIGIRI
ncbi:MAG: NADH oxidase [Deltaproteobacteria bacterium RIFCSPLOWO2_12_FULL_60_16]|nr:MAG: NADH oxidase [Deltaproteobacteria bacterium RIFCSPLOWO2_12_FULL_60_16]